MPYVNQVEEARQAESPAPWISDRRSGTTKVCVSPTNSLTHFRDAPESFKICKSFFHDSQHILADVHALKTTSDIINLHYSIMAPLIAEYDRHMDDMTEQLQRYQVKSA